MNYWTNHAATRRYKRAPTSPAQFTCYSSKTLLNENEYLKHVLYKINRNTSIIKPNTDETKETKETYDNNNESHRLGTIHQRYVKNDWARHKTIQNT